MRRRELPLLWDGDDPTEARFVRHYVTDLYALKLGTDLEGARNAGALAENVLEKGTAFQESVKTFSDRANLALAVAGGIGTGIDETATKGERTTGALLTAYGVDRLCWSFLSSGNRQPLQIIILGFK